MAWAPLAAAGIGAAGSVAGGLISQGGNQSAVNSLRGEQAGINALTQSAAQSGQDRSALSPWTQTGGAATDLVGQLLGLGQLKSSGDVNGTMFLDPSNWQQNQQSALQRFQTDPGYQFRLQQGVNALDRGAGARGMRFSGAQAKALSDYGQNTGSAEYANWFNRLAGLSGQGLTAQNAANTQSNDIMKTGINADFLGTSGQGQQAAGYGVAGNNAFASGLIGAGNSAASGLMATNWNNLLGGGTSSQGIPGGPGIYA
jgi:hypothetical protein